MTRDYYELIGSTALLVSCWSLLFYGQEVVVGVIQTIKVMM